MYGPTCPTHISGEPCPTCGQAMPAQRFGAWPPITGATTLIFSLPSTILLGGLDRAVDRLVEKAKLVVGLKAPAELRADELPERRPPPPPPARAAWPAQIRSFG